MHSNTRLSVAIKFLPLHGRLGMRTSTMSFDITHACSGFIYGVGIGKSLIMGKLTENVVLVTADTYSRLLHQNDRSTRPLFGDGAAATMITRTKEFLKLRTRASIRLANKGIDHY